MTFGTVSAGLATFPDDRVVLLLNGPVVNQRRLCQDAIPDGGGPGPRGRIEIVAAFCSGNRPVSTLAGGIGSITDPNDPRLRAFLRQVVRTLFNPNNPNDRPGRNSRLLSP